MKGRIKIVTLAVDDLEAALCCYRDGLGLNTDGILGQEFGDCYRLRSFDVRLNLTIADFSLMWLRLGKQKLLAKLEKFTSFLFICGELSG